MIAKCSIEREHFRVLIIRFSSIGDIILTTPLLKAIKKKYSNAEIDYLTLSEYSSLLKFNPHIKNLITVNRERGFSDSLRKALSLRKNQYRYVFDLHRSGRSLLFRLLLNRKRHFVLNKHYIKRALLINLKINLYKKPYSVVNRHFNAVRVLNLSPDGGTEIWIGDLELRNAIIKINKISGMNLILKSEGKNNTIKIEKKIIQKSGQKVISMMPFAKWKTKEWGDVKFVELGRQITENKNATLLIPGGRDDAVRAEAAAGRIGDRAISVAGKLSLLETAIALSLSDVLVTNDTGVMHIGGAVSIPVIAIFGPTTEELGFFPYASDAKVVQLDLDCRPCSAKGFIKCPKNHFKCMNDITVEKVYSSMVKYLY